MNRIVVMIPCLNEAVAISEVISDFKSSLPEAEIYVFDNGSTDCTAEKAREAGAHVINVNRRGKGNVVKSMFKTLDADIYIMVDGDGTYPADNVRNLIRPIEEQRADMVIGDRLSSSYFEENKRLFHNNGNRIVRNLINWIFNADIHDLLSGYRAFSRRFVKSVALQSSGFEIETELTVAAIVNDLNIEEITVPYKDRSAGSNSKLNTISDGILILSTIFKLFRDYKPMLFFSIIAAVLAIIAIGVNIPVVNDYLITGKVDRFPTLFCGGFLLTGALMLFCVGLILQVISNRNKIIIDTILLHSNSNSNN